MSSHDMKSVRKFISVLLLLTGLISSGATLAGQYLLFKGLNVTQSCLDPLLTAPSGVTYYTQQLNFICTKTSYSDSDILVYDDVEKSCISYSDFIASTSADIHDVYIMFTGISGSLDTIIEAMFMINNNAVVSFNASTGEVEQIDATACGASGGGGGGGGGTPTDTDSDGDPDSVDNCVYIPNPDQTDTDNDGVGDLCDNCVLTANADQLNTDGDFYGNACDGDLNNDFMVNSQDIGLFKAAFFTRGASSADFNGDAIVNSLDTGLLKQMLFKQPGL
jgi:hypothetical protein